MIKNISNYLFFRSFIIFNNFGGKGTTIAVKCIKAIYMFVKVWETCINMFKDFIQEEDSSIRYIVIRKFQKDIKSLSTNKIIKRTIYTGGNKYPKQTKKVLVKEGINEDNANQISKHPMILAETTEGDVIVANHTSSSIVDNELTIKVGIQENGKPSYLPVNKSEIMKEKTVEQIVKAISSQVDKVKEVVEDVYDNNSKKGNEIANNTSEALGSKHGVEIKNKNLESIESIGKEPIDKL